MTAVFADFSYIEAFVSHFLKVFVAPVLASTLDAFQLSETNIKSELLCEKEEDNLSDRYVVSMLNCLSVYFPTCAFYADVALRYGDRCFAPFLFPSKCTFIT